MRYIHSFIVHMGYWYMIIIVIFYNDDTCKINRNHSYPYVKTSLVLIQTLTTQCPIRIRVEVVYDSFSKRFLKILKRQGGLPLLLRSTRYTNGGEQHQSEKVTSVSQLTHHHSVTQKLNVKGLLIASSR